MMLFMQHCPLFCTLFREKIAFCTNLHTNANVLKKHLQSFAITKFEPFLDKNAKIYAYRLHRYNTL